VEVGNENNPDPPMTARSVYTDVDDVADLVHHGMNRLWNELLLDVSVNDDAVNLVDQFFDQRTAQLIGVIVVYHRRPAVSK